MQPRAGPTHTAPCTHARWCSGTALAPSGAVILWSAMADSVSCVGVLGLLLVSALPGVLGDRSSPDLRAHPGISEGYWREARTAHGSQAPALLTRLCPPPQETPSRSALRPRNPGDGRRPRTSASGPGSGLCLWGRCTPQLSWLLCCTSVCRCGTTRGGDTPGLNFP